MSSTEMSEEALQEARESVSGVAQVIEGMGVPTPPTVLLQIKMELGKQTPDLKLIEELAQRNMAIAARVLKLANSAYFGAGREPLQSIPEAYVRLGFKNFREVIVAAAARETLSANTPIDDQVWTHAEEVAVLCKCLASKLCAMLDESAYMVGLFHDCALPSMMKVGRKKIEDFSKLIRYLPLNTQTERDEFLIDHSTFAYHITQSWGVSDDARLAILHHHAFSVNEKLTREAQMMQAILMLAENILSEERGGNSFLFGKTGTLLMMSIAKALRTDAAELGKLRYEVYAQLIQGN